MCSGHREHDLTITARWRVVPVLRLVAGRHYRDSDSSVAANEERSVASKRQLLITGVGVEKLNARSDLVRAGWCG